MTIFDRHHESWAVALRAARELWGPFSAAHCFKAQLVCYRLVAPARKRMGAKSRLSLPGLTRQSIHFVKTFLQRSGSSPRMTGWTRLLRQFDNLVHALYAVIDRDLKDRMLFLDPQSRFFRGFVGRV